MLSMTNRQKNHPVDRVAGSTRLTPKAPMPKRIKDTKARKIILRDEGINNLNKEIEIMTIRFLNKDTLK
ncbi:MAG: hypothetical protein JKY66_09365 [Spongiibacteraceae bacterium]|nr:hypothetical protein [Spongiibacteraceae bacterium]